MRDRPMRQRVGSGRSKQRPYGMQGGEYSGVDLSLYVEEDCA
jgi:hypothetical protein